MNHLEIFEKGEEEVEEKKECTNYRDPSIETLSLNENTSTLSHHSPLFYDFEKPKIDLKDFQIISHAYENKDNKVSKAYCSFKNGTITIILKYIFPKDRNLDIQEEKRIKEEFAFLDKLHTSSPNNYLIKPLGIHTIEMPSHFKCKNIKVISLEAGFCSMQDIINIRNKENKNYTDEEILFIFDHIIDILLWLEERHIAHCDIKPHNFFLCKDNKNIFVYKIGDFGISIELPPQKTTTRHLKGQTHFFASPEVKDVFRKIENSFKKIDPFISDVYSLGITILFLMGFKYEEIKQIKKNSFILSQISDRENLKKVLEQMLKKNPKERIHFKDIKNLIKDFTKTPPNEEAFIKIFENIIMEKETFLNWEKEQIKNKEKEKTIFRDTAETEKFDFFNYFQGLRQIQYYHQIKNFQMAKAIRRKYHIEQKNYLMNFLKNGSIDKNIISNTLVINKMLLKALNYYDLEEWEKASNYIETVKECFIEVFGEEVENSIGVLLCDMFLCDLYVKQNNLEKLLDWKLYKSENTELFKKHHLVLGVLQQLGLDTPEGKPNNQDDILKFRTELNEFLCPNTHNFFHVYGKGPALGNACELMNKFDKGSFLSTLSFFMQFFEIYYKLFRGFAPSNRFERLYHIKYNEYNQNIFGTGINFYKQGNFKQAKKKFKEYLKTAYNPLIDHNLFLIGKIHLYFSKMYLRKNQFKKAHLNFQKGYNIIIYYFNKNSNKDIFRMYENQYKTIKFTLSPEMQKIFNITVQGEGLEYDYLIKNFLETDVETSFSAIRSFKFFSSQYFATKFPHLFFSFKTLAMYYLKEKRLEKTLQILQEEIYLKKKIFGEKHYSELFPKLQQQIDKIIEENL